MYMQAIGWVVNNLKIEIYQEIVFHKLINTL